jgi:excisionase family DNA binding protein
MPRITKAAAVEILGVTPRAIERYTKHHRLSVVYERGRTKPAPTYDEDEVKRLAEELRSPVQPSLIPNNATNANVGVAFSSKALEAFGNTQGMAILVMALREALHGTQAPVTANAEPSVVDLAAKLTLSIDEAARVSGLSANMVREAIKTGKLKAKIIGRGYRVKRPDLDSYVRKL